MSGPQFMHLQSYSRKANPRGQSVEQVLAEAARAPVYSKHVVEPQPPSVVYGVAANEVRKLHDDMVAAGGIDVTLKDGRKTRRGIRKDRHTLMTAVASHPLPTELVNTKPNARADYEIWREHNVVWLKTCFGDKLVSVIEHWDEEHPHLHAYILPLGDATCSARQLNPAWQAKEEAMEVARAAGHDDKAALNFGNAAYRSKARELQDHYYEHVSLACGLTRTGPKRERLNRQQWKARKDQARRDAKLQSDIEKRVERIVNAEDDLEESVSEKAKELAEKLALVDQAKQEAEDAKIRATKRARKVVEAAKEDVRQLQQKVREDLAARTSQIEAAEAELEQKRRAFDFEKRRVVKRVVLDVARVTVRVLTGVFIGTVQTDPKQSSFTIADKSLARSVEDYGIRSYLEKPVTAVLSFWQKISSFAPRDQVASLAQDLKGEIGLGSPSSDRGAEP
ncbi:hypothetical protein KUV51_12095 [Tateyamaria omphalii]|uniref:hypothetical protein n=1 Tax=Tateyamaria omphalii TaxID=299262 RepID=UPI001C99D090|nr:hypothetical protein [Tateyamaria omphalii]MBY5933743.1 hypothetical protein [Tateyamaria omphalii]